MSNFNRFITSESINELSFRKTVPNIKSYLKGYIKLKALTDDFPVPVGPMILKGASLVSIQPSKQVIQLTQS